MPATETESELISMRWHALSSEEIADILYWSYWCSRASIISGNIASDKIYGCLTRWAWAGLPITEKDRLEDIGKQKAKDFESALRRRGLI